MPRSSASQPTTSNPAIAEFLQQQIDAGLIAGAVVGVCDRNAALSVTCCGLAEIASQRPMSVDTLFWVASCSKPIVATAVMQLVEQGLIALDDPVEKHLPMFRGIKRIARQDEIETVLVDNETPFTIRQCLSHTSGLPFLSRVEHGFIDRLPLAQAVVAYASSALEFKPGAAYRYSNAGINTVAHILERVSGLDFSSYLQQHILQPLGMQHSTIWPNAADEAGMAICYAPNEQSVLEPQMLGTLTPPFANPQRGAHPGGCLFSTVHDILEFCRMILNGGDLDGQHYLNQTLIDEMTREQTGIPDKDYGLGWKLDQRGFGHLGAAGTHIHIVPAADRACVYLIQRQGSAKDHAHILPQLHQMVFDEKI